MEKLLEGLTRFQNEIFPKHRERYEALANGQQPHTLFIGCSDSRVMPSEMLQARAGELFVCRNAGNIVPAYSDNLGGVSATVEYAVQVLKVKHVVVCGHSDCGAMKAVLHPEQVQHLRAVKQWILHAERVSAVTRELGIPEDDPSFLDRLIEENVETQLDNLMTHPFVAARVKAGHLTLHGMVFDIKSGKFSILDREHGKFVSTDQYAAKYYEGRIAHV